MTQRWTTPRRETTPLTKQQEAVLARRIEAGLAARAAAAGDLRRPGGATASELARIEEEGSAAFDELVARNLPLVGYVVNPIARMTGLDRDDLAQEGMVGLLEAARRFDPQRGGFASCALPWIRMRAWDEAVTAHGALGLPARRARRWRRAVAAQAELAEQLARTPTPDEVAVRAGESEGTVRTLLTFRPTCRLTDEHEQVLPAALPAPEGSLDLGGLLRGLAPVQRRILVLRHGLGEGEALTTVEIAERVQLSASTVRRYEQSALATLRAAANGPLAA